MKYGVYVGLFVAGAVVGALLDHYMGKLPTVEIKVTPHEDVVTPVDDTTVH